MNAFTHRLSSLVVSCSRDFEQVDVPQHYSKFVTGLVHRLRDVSNRAVAQGECAFSCSTVPSAAFTRGIRRAAMHSVPPPQLMRDSQFMHALVDRGALFAVG